MTTTDPSATVDRDAAITALADRFVEAIERGDIPTVRSIYADDATIWHNFDNIDSSADDNAKQIRWFTSRLAGMKYTEIRRVVIGDGFVQQHVLRGTAPNGDAVAVHAMLRVYTDGTRITRLEEYLDPAQAASLALPATG